MDALSACSGYISTACFISILVVLRLQQAPLRVLPGRIKLASLRHSNDMYQINQFFMY